MSELPKGWVECKLVDFVQYLPTGVPKFIGEKEYYSTGSIQDSKYIPEGIFAFDNRPSRANRISKIGDVFQARMKGTDKGLLIDDKLNNKLFSTGFIQLRPYENTYESKLLYYFVKSKIFIDQKDELVTGSTQEALTDSKAKELTILVPPLNEQKRIVEKLDKLLSKVEEAKARLEKIPVILKRFRQSVLNAAVTGELTKDWRERNGINEEWEEESLRKLCKKFTYGSSKKSDVKGKVPVLRMGNIQDGKIVWDDLKYSSDADEILKYSLKDGDVLFNRTNSPELVGKTAIYRGERPAIYAGYLIKITTNENLEPEFLNLCLNSVKSKEWCMQVKTDGVSQSNINAKKLADFKILTPPLEEQKEIVHRVESLFKKADEIEERYKKAKEYVDKLTQSILAKAFRGELVPQDPNDEPASVLLERIKLEKEKLNKDKKQKKRARAGEFKEKHLDRVRE